MSTNGMKTAVKAHYWDREDFDQLMGIVRHVDNPNPQAELDSATSLNYPKSLEGAFRELRFRGLEFDIAELKLLVGDGVILPDGIDHPEDDFNKQRWEKHHIDAAAGYLYERRRWSSWVHYCYVNNLSYGQCVKAYRAACIRFGLPVTWSFDVAGINQTIEAAGSDDEFAFVRFFPVGTALGEIEVEDEGDAE